VHCRGDGAAPETVGEQDGADPEGGDVRGGKDGADLEAGRGGQGRRRLRSSGGGGRGQGRRTERRRSGSGRRAREEKDPGRRVLEKMSKIELSKFKKSRKDPSSLIKIFKNLE
jgi:hypothetical protein